MPTTTEHKKYTNQSKEYVEFKQNSTHINTYYHHYFITIYTD